MRPIVCFPGRMGNKALAGIQAQPPLTAHDLQPVVTGMQQAPGDRLALPENRSHQG